MDKFLLSTKYHYGDVIMGTIASQITIVYSTVYSDADQRKRQRSAPLPFVRGIHRGPVNSPHKWPVTRKMFPFDDVIMNTDGLNPASRLGHGYVSISTEEGLWDVTTLIPRFMGPTWGPSGADRTHTGPMLAPWTLLSMYSSKWTLQRRFKGKYYIRNGRNCLTLQSYLNHVCLLFVA